MVLNEKPVADILAPAIDRKWLTITYIVDKQWNKFLWKLVWAVVV